MITSRRRRTAKPNDEPLFVIVPTFHSANVDSGRIADNMGFNAYIHEQFENWPDR
jgi:hypothetical protein